MSVNCAPKNYAREVPVVWSEDWKGRARSVKNQKQKPQKQKGNV